MIVERIIPNTKDWNLDFKRHLIRYNFSLSYIKNKNVLDVACGSGYFSNYLLSKGAKSVTGVDIGEDSIIYAKNNFQNISLKFLERDAENLDSLNESFDIVVSMEKIEHLNYPIKILSGAKNVLIPNGYLPKPYVSVIMPTYNFADRISPTIKSILNQTYQNFELIVVDDGSYDNTQEVINSFKDPRIYYFWKENSGGASARNSGIKKAQGEYIAFCDQDDIWLPKKLEIQLDFMNKNKDIGLSATGFSIINHRGETIRTSRVDIIIDLPEILRRNYYTISFSVIMITTELLKKIGFMNKDYKLCDDYDLIIRAVLFSKVKCIPYQLVKIIKHEKNASQNTLNVSREISSIITRYLNSININDPRLPSKIRYSIQSQVLFNEAKCAFFTHKRKTAIRKFIRSIKISPTNIEAYLFLPFCLLGPQIFEYFIPIYEIIFRRKYIKYI